MRLLLFTFFAFVSVSNAQTDSLAVLQGAVKDKNGEFLIGVSLKILQNGEFVKSTITDYDGIFQFSLKPGKYDLEAKYTRFTTTLVKGIVLEKQQILQYDIVLADSIFIELPFICGCCLPPIIDFDPENTGATFTAYQIRKRY